jgi:hypothetical protein
VSYAEEQVPGEIREVRTAALPAADLGVLPTEG